MAPSTPTKSPRKGRVETTGPKPYVGTMCSRPYTMGNISSVMYSRAKTNEA